MKVILKQDVENLGRKGDIVNVKAGYGRNYLIPRKMALEVTSSNLRMVEMERRALKKKLEKERLSYQELVQKLNALSLTFSRKAGEKDLIFGSVSVGDIREALTERGFDIEKRKIILEEPIKRLGNYVVPVRVSPDDRAELKIEVRKEAEQEGTHESVE
ncbi:MAG: 50S ribosomal protein L9, partial [Candidatus Aminicenantes bacterium]|nr:50S ribosomal protein L9 [Candidatus Aminicenantes bacterium]